MRRLFAVEISHIMYVVAESADEAEEVAEEHQGDDDSEVQIHARPIKSESELPPEILSSLPWGDANDKKTVGDWVKISSQALLKCAHCGKDVDYDDAKACPKCQRPLCKKGCPEPSGGCEFWSPGGESVG